MGSCAASRTRCADGVSLVHSTALSHSRYCRRLGGAAGVGGPPQHDLGTPAEYDAAEPAVSAPGGKVDPRVKETLLFLRRGMRGYCGMYARGARLLRVGDRLLLP